MGKAQRAHHQLTINFVACPSSSTISHPRRFPVDYRRLYQPGSSYFFTLVTEQRRPLLVTHIDRLREAFRRVRSRQAFHIDAIVILPDHLHTLWTLPEGDADYSGRWMRIKRLFSTGLPAMPSNQSQLAKREKGVWQRRFWEHGIRDETDWCHHMDYIHYNPVKHGQVQRVMDWPFSSFPRCVEIGWYDRDWGQPVPQEILAMDLD